jgi:hypothetical protein
LYYKIVFFVAVQTTGFGRGATQRRFKAEPSTTVESTPPATAASPGTSLISMDTVTAILIEVRQQVQNINTKLDALKTVAENNSAALKELTREVGRVETIVREHTGARGITLEQLQSEINVLQSSNSLWGRTNQSLQSENMDIIIDHFKKLAENVNTHTENITRDHRVASIQELGYLIRRECNDVAPAAAATLESKLKRIHNAVNMVHTQQARLKSMVGEFQNWTRNRLSIAEIDLTGEQPGQAGHSRDTSPSISAAARTRQTSPPRPSSSTVARVKGISDRQAGPANRHNVTTRPDTPPIAMPARRRGGTPMPDTPPPSAARLLCAQSESSDDEMLYAPPSPPPPMSPCYMPTSPSYRPGDFSDSGEEDIKPPQAEPPRKRRKGRQPTRIQTRSTASSAATANPEPAPVPAPAPPAQEPDPAMLDEADEEMDS